MKHELTAFAYCKRGRLLAIGRNNYVKSHPIQARFAAKVGQPQKIYLHAEIDALLKARQKVHRLVVVRVKKDGNYGNARPCVICREAIRFFGVAHIEHS